MSGILCQVLLLGEASILFAPLKFGNLFARYGMRCGHVVYGVKSCLEDELSCAFYISIFTG